MLLVSIDKLIQNKKNPENLKLFLLYNVTKICSKRSFDEKNYDFTNCKMIY